MAGLREKSGKAMLDGDSWAGLFARGDAYGHSNIRTDTVDFRFENEHFCVPTIHTIGLAKWNGYFYVAKVKDLRRWKKKAEGSSS